MVERDILITPQIGDATANLSKQILAILPSSGSLNENWFFHNVTFLCKFYGSACR